MAQRIAKASVLAAAAVLSLAITDLKIRLVVAKLDDAGSDALVNYYASLN